MDVATLTLEQLESLAYRQIRQLELTQNNLRLLNAEIEKRMAEAPVNAQIPDEPVE